MCPGWKSLSMRTSGIHGLLGLPEQAKKNCICRESSLYNAMDRSISDFCMFDDGSVNCDVCEKNVGGMVANTEYIPVFSSAIIPTSENSTVPTTDVWVVRAHKSSCAPLRTTTANPTRRAEDYLKHPPPSASLSPIVSPQRFEITHQSSVSTVGFTSSSTQAIGGRLPYHKNVFFKLYRRHGQTYLPGCPRERLWWLCGCS